jgi:hypothetical protein
MFRFGMVDVLEEVLGLLRELGLKFSVEGYGDERVVVVDLGEDFSVYISILCRGGECDVEYAIGDENFIIRPERVDLLGRAVDIITRVNSKLRGQG